MIEEYAEQAAYSRRMARVLHSDMLADAPLDVYWRVHDEICEAQAFRELSPTVKKLVHVIETKQIELDRKRAAEVLSPDEEAIEDDDDGEESERDPRQGY